MFEKKKQPEYKPYVDKVELENQFIMRFPKVGCASLFTVYVKLILFFLISYSTLRISCTNRFNREPSRIVC